MPNFYAATIVTKLNKIYKKTTKWQANCDAFTICNDNEMFCTSWLERTMHNAQLAYKMKWNEIKKKPNTEMVALMHLASAHFAKQTNNFCHVMRLHV